MSDWENTLAADLRKLSGHLMRRLRAEGGFGNLSWTQVSVLGHLERDGPRTVTMLARAERMRPQSMGTTVSFLETAGLLAGTPHPTDGRQTLFSLTESGRSLIIASRASRQDWLCNAIRTLLTPAEQKDLEQGVKLLNRIIKS